MLIIGSFSHFFPCIIYFNVCRWSFDLPYAEDSMNTHDIVMELSGRSFLGQQTSGPYVTCVTKEAHTLEYIVVCEIYVKVLWYTYLFHLKLRTFYKNSWCPGIRTCHLMAHLNRWSHASHNHTCLRQVKRMKSNPTTILPSIALPTSCNVCGSILQALLPGWWQPKSTVHYSICQLGHWRLENSYYE